MKRLEQLTEWSHFKVVANNQIIIGRKVNDTVAVCHNFTSNDKNWVAPVGFGKDLYPFESLNMEEIRNFQKAGWFNEKFYKEYEDYENLVNAG